MKRTAGKRGGPETDSGELLEKYLHSRGAKLLSEGKVDEAMVCLEGALNICDTPYSHYELSRAYAVKGAPGKALKEITRAIDLLPGVAGYYCERAMIWETLNEPALAAQDRAAMIGLDSNYERIETIRKAIGDMEKVFERKDTFPRKPSCPVKTCPAYCCHFPGKVVLHGVTIGSWKLHAIRQWIKEKGLGEQDYLKRLPFNGEGHIAALIPPQYILPERGEHCIYYPARKEYCINREILKDLPKGRDYNDLLWINESARPCAFLNEGRCAVYGVGDETSLDSCGEFLCLTGFVFIVTEWLGIIDNALLAGKTMEDLNRIAVETLLAVSPILADYQDGEDLMSKGPVQGLTETVRAYFR